MRKSATTILRILQITETSSYLVENSLNKFHYLGIVLLISVFMTVSTHTVAASTTMIITPTPTPIPTPIPTPTPTPTPSVTTPNTQLNLETLFRTLLTQELSSADSVVHTTELERILDDIAGGQYQISAEFEDENGEEDTEKTLTITINPIGPTATPTEEEEAEPEDDSSGDNGDDNGNDDSPEESEPLGEIPGSPPFG
jgi:hypothetical protein